MNISPEFKASDDVTEGQEWRCGPRDTWEAGPCGLPDIWVEVRPKRQPDPLSLSSAVVDGRTLHTTTVGEMRDRTDLDQWEVANWDHGEWGTYEDPLYWEDPDDFPVIVRRKP